LLWGSLQVTSTGVKVRHSDKFMASEWWLYGKVDEKQFLCFYNSSIHLAAVLI